MHSPDAASNRGVRFHVAALAVAVLLALAETWPLATVLTTHFPHSHGPFHSVRSGDAHPDALLTAWILASNVRRLGEDPLGVFETNNMAPFRHTLAYSENFLGVTMPIWPVQLAWNNPVLSCNLALLFVLALSAYGVLLLIHELTNSVVAAAVGAALATYAPFVWDNITQLHAVSGLAAALAWFSLLRLVRTRHWRWAMLLGALTSWQVWASLHWGLFLMLGLGSGIAVLLVSSAAARRVLPQLVVAGTVALVLTLPLVAPYAVVAREMGLRDPGSVAFLPLSAVGAPFLKPFSYLGARLGGGERTMGVMTLAPWLAMTAGLIASAVVRRPRVIPGTMLAALATSGFVAFWYACGPRPFLGLPSLYALVSGVPGLGIVRAPLRAIQYTNLVIAVLAGCGMAALLCRLPGRVAAVSAVAAVLTMTVVEAGWKAGGIAAAPPRNAGVAAPLAALPADCAIAEVPDSFSRQALALFQSTAHWRPLVNGRSGFYPVGPFVESWFLNQFPAPAAVAYLRAAGACAVLVHENARRGRSIMKKVFARHLAVRPLGGSKYLVTVPAGVPQGADAPTLERTDWRVVEPAAADAMLDGSLDTRIEFAVANAEPLARLVVDLGRPTLVSGLDVELGSQFRLYLQTYRVETSPDGVHWATAAQSSTALPPLESYRIDSHAVAQRIRFSPREARFLRLGPVRPSPLLGVVAPDVGFTRWGVAELNLRGAVPRS